MKVEIPDIEKINEIIIAFADGDFSKRLELTAKLDERNVIVSGINMLGEELEEKTIWRDHFSSIYNAIPEILVVLNEEGITTNVNNAFVNSLGFSENEIQHESYELFLNQVFHLPLQELINAKRHYHHFEAILKRKNGTLLPASCSISYITGKDDQHKGYLFIAKDVTEQKLQDQQMLKATLKGQETERERLAHDLHDSLGQELNAIKMYINAFEKMDSSSDLFKATITESKELMDGVIDSLREISFNLRPSVFTKGDLFDALSQLISQIEKIEKVKLHFSAPKILSYVNTEDELIIYRIVQEFINNTLKHAQAKNITIKIIEKSNHLSIDLLDDGKGFNFSSIKKNNGIYNITSRLEALNAKYDFTSEPGSGTILNFTIHAENT